MMLRRRCVVVALAGALLATPASGASQQPESAVAARSLALRPPSRFAASTAAASARAGAELGLPTRARLEIAAVAVTGALHLGFRALDATAVFIPVASIGWGGYVYHRARREPELLAELGLRSTGLGPSFRDATLFAAPAAALIAGVAAARGTLDLHPDLLPLLALYPVWGVVQQTLVQGMVARNLDRADGWLGSPYAVVPISAVLFGAVHLPDWKLTAATTALGAAFTPIYLRHRNVWPLGLYHGVLGALFYFWVLDENPWRDLR